MVRRGRRPSFGPTEIARLLGAMRTARYDALLCGAAAGYGSERHKKCEALTKAIDALAEELIGDPEFYWNKPAEGRSA
jgi:hypothetical protein